MVNEIFPKPNQMNVRKWANVTKVDRKREKSGNYKVIKRFIARFEVFTK